MEADTRVFVLDAMLTVVRPPPLIDARLPQLVGGSIPGDVLGRDPGGDGDGDGESP